MELEIDKYCFACGVENPIGLKLVFHQDTEGVTTSFIPAREHQGYVNILHGGIISTLLDEAMGHAVIAKGYHAVTVRMELTFRKPTLINTQIELKGKVLEKKGRMIKTVAEISQEGNLTAEAAADFLIVKNQVE
jgi:acyl-coenzyme A thioesterase PaaI-like protein